MRTKTAAFRLPYKTRTKNNKVSAVTKGRLNLEIVDQIATRPTPPKSHPTP